METSKKICTCCKLELSSAWFVPDPRYKSCLRSRCRVCSSMSQIANCSPHRREYQRNYRREHQKELWARHGKTWGEWRSHKRKLVRNEVFAHYGNVCACCGESTHEFLTIDHINNNGSTERRALGIQGGVSFYAWLKKHEYPDGYQLLCYNCNCSKGHFGYCPHQKRELDERS